MIAWIAGAATLLVIIGARLWTNHQMLTTGMVEKRVSSIYLVGFFGFIAASVVLFVTVAWWAFVLAWLAYFLSHKLIPSVLPQIAQNPYLAGTAALQQASEELSLDLLISREIEVSLDLLRATRPQGTVLHC